MSAVAGIWRFDGKPNASDACGRMLSAQEIYGRDGGAQWADGPVALGSRLTRLLPEDAFDRQPIIGGGGNYVLVADMRIDNRDELTAALAIDPARARNMCDAAILMAAFEKWDDNCCEHIVGEYAFALWDAGRHRLVLVRSPLAARPLHFHRGNGFFAFASMPKGLHALPDVPYAPDEEKVAELLLLLPEAGTRSYFAGIERVPVGHTVTISDSAVTVRRHWFPSSRTIVLGSADEYAEALRHHLDDAVRRQLRGTSEVGSHLSGGIDSSAVAATAARLLQPAAGKVVAFTAVPRKGYAGPDPLGRFGDEGPHAAATAAMYPNIHHVLVRNHGRNMFDDLDRSFFLCDQPFNNPCNMGWFFGINDAARDRKLKVMLTGQMGNMTVSYSGAELLPELIRSGRWWRWWREAAALVHRRRMHWGGVLIRSFGAWLPDSVWKAIHRLFNRPLEDALVYTALNATRMRELDLRGRARDRQLDPLYRPRTDAVETRLWVIHRRDAANIYKGILGGWGIDMRDPTIDRRLVELCLAIPTEQFLRDGAFSVVGRRALADRLPQAVLAETRKGYQAVDWHEGLTAARPRIAEEIERIAATPSAAQTLDIPRMRRLLKDWPTGGWETHDVQSNYRLAFMRGLSNGHFLRRATGGNR